MLHRVRVDKNRYHFIEVMNCPGGCVNGGGQPYHYGNTAILKKRLDALYTEDRNKPLRKSHKNPSILKLYEEFLGEPGSHLAHHLLHTTYVNRKG